jgi:hypothetical protein
MGIVQFVIGNTGKEKLSVPAKIESVVSVIKAGIYKAIIAQSTERKQIINTSVYFNIMPRFSQFKSILSGSIKNVNTGKIGNKGNIGIFDSIVTEWCRNWI